MSPEAGTLRCPSCGALAEPESRSCPYCSAALALTSCPSCFASMFVGARHCSRCGAAAARRTIERPARPCPECRSPLGSLALGTALLDECRGCGGVFVDRESFDRICTEREQQAAVALETRLAAPPNALPSRGDRYWPCPDCGRLMNRKNFARVSGVVLDVCRDHGVWFNQGELTRIVEFIRGGGMERAREREKADLQQERELLRQQQSLRSVSDARLSTEGSGRQAEVDSLWSLAAHLFDDIFLQ